MYIISSFTLFFLYSLSFPSSAGAPDEWCYGLWASMGVLCQSRDLRLLFRSKSGFGCVERVRTFFSLKTETFCLVAGRRVSVFLYVFVTFNRLPLAPVGQRCHRMGNPVDLFCQPDYTGLLFRVKPCVRCAKWVRANLCSGFGLQCAKRISVFRK